MTAIRATPATSARATATVTTTVPAAPQPTINIMIVCVPDGTRLEALTTAFPKPLGGTAEPVTRLWANDTPRFWHRRALLGVRRGGKGVPTLCAGGPIRRLNLAGMRDTAGFYASLRHQQWQYAVTGTRAAKPWHEFEALHRAHPTTLPMETARTQFLAQSRINAMRIFNEANYTSAPLDPYDIEMFQAGPQAYQNYHAMRAVCGDAVLPPRGIRLQPASDSFADRITYLGAAMRLLYTLPERQHIIAIAL